MPHFDKHGDFMTIIADRDCTITLLTAQITSLRRSHDAYIASLHQAHEKELGALKLYTELLEGYHGTHTRESPGIRDKG